MIEESGGAERYQFCHALLQETLGSELSSARRVRLHARIAEALEEMCGANVGNHAAELAYHFVEAEPVVDTGKLVRYLLLAGEQALATYGYEDAMSRFQRALKAKEGQEIDSDAAAVLLVWVGLRWPASPDTRFIWPFPA